MCVTAAAHSKGSGRMARGMGWAWRRGTDGSTAGSGRRATRAGTACARAPSATPSTREPGPTDCRTVTAQKLTRTAVSIISFLSLPNWIPFRQKYLRLHGRGILTNGRSLGENTLLYFNYTITNIHRLLRPDDANGTRVM